MFIAPGVDVEDFLIERTVACVVHAQHHGNNRGLVRENVALQAVVDAAAAAPGHPVAAPARVNKANVHCREPRDDVSFDEGRIKPLIGDTIPVKDDPVALLDCKRALGQRARGQCKKTKPGTQSQPARFVVSSPDLSAAGVDLNKDGPFQSQPRKARAPT